ncbi:MAG: pyridoxamine 5'-phosphate oxidase family protein [Flavobacteriaceae bacterium]|nr:pyridoxamine 5'-phosphate oxidase family protein [Bacteroidia bacterium]NNF74758.1 pyridoxamine 5'-phosphate oxidase family protein [Flavobacteriaceae bacterium]
MGKRNTAIDNKQRDFIEQQKMFFVGTAAETGRVNLSPKGMDTLRVLGSNRVVWLNLTGSGNETAAHVLQNQRMTLMFCAFEGNPLILRLYGRAKVYHRRDKEYEELNHLFPNIPGSRQIFDLEVEMVQNSCGFGVPLYDFAGQRTLLEDWAKNKGAEGLKDYWKQKNTTSLDNFETKIIDEL